MQKRFAIHWQLALLLSSRSGPPFHFIFSSRRSGPPSIHIFDPFLKKWPKNKNIKKSIIKKMTKNGFWTLIFGNFWSFSKWIKIDKNFEKRPFCKDKAYVWVLGEIGSKTPTQAIIHFLGPFLIKMMWVSPSFWLFSAIFKIHRIQTEHYEIYNKKLTEVRVRGSGIFCYFSNYFSSLSFCFCI